MESFTMFLFSSAAVILILTTGGATDTLLPNQTLDDGDAVVSAGGVFELGFFSLGDSGFRYLGIWYKKIAVRTIVWIANRQVPLNDPSGVLKVDDKGVLELLSVSNTLIWSSGTSKLARNVTPVVRLLDSGNLVVRDNIGGGLIWQSFDHPGDTLLPGMKLGVDLVTGIERNLTSWKQFDDPSSGVHTVRMDIRGYPQLYDVKEGSSFISRLGFWNGLRLSGMSGLRPNRVYTFEFVLSDKEIYYSYELTNSSVLSRMIADPHGVLTQMAWSDKTQSWMVYSTSIQDFCDQYNHCGAYGSCNIENAPPCGCLSGFEPKLRDEEWSKGDYTSGCKQKTPMAHENGHDFIKFSGLILPDSKGSWFNSSMTLRECEKVCLSNFNCTAFANADIRGGGSGCLLWFDELVDIRKAPVDDDSG